MKTKKIWIFLTLIFISIALILLLVSNLIIKPSDNIVLGERNKTGAINVYGQKSIIEIISSLAGSGVIWIFTILSFIFTRSKNEKRHTIRWTYIIIIVLVSINLFFNIFLINDIYRFLNIESAKNDFVPGEKMGDKFLAKDELTITTNAYSKLQIWAILSILSYFLYLWTLISASISLYYTIKLKRKRLKN